MSKEKPDSEGGEVISLLNHPGFMPHGGYNDSMDAMETLRNMHPEPDQESVDRTRAAIESAVVAAAEANEAAEIEGWRKWLKRKFSEILRGDE